MIFRKGIEANGIPFPKRGQLPSLGFSLSDNPKCSLDVQSNVAEILCLGVVEICTKCA